MRHKTHFTQPNVMRDKEKFPTEVELVEIGSLEIRCDGRLGKLRLTMQSLLFRLPV